MKKRLLLLEDDTNLNETVCEFLESKGYEVMAVFDGEEAEDTMFEHHFDLFLLDVNVPSLSGFDLLSKVRKEGNTTPAIFLTSLNAIENVEEGYESGCDDYVRKPFALKELLFRIESILKREFFHSPKSTLSLSESVVFDTNTNTLLVDNQPVQLQKKEAILLKLFLQKPNEIITHAFIMSHVWEYEEEGSDDALRTYIKNLRKIIGKDRIVNLKKLGYKFTSQ
ncbi:MAG: response regulator transcription factor [Sulfurospirillum sp.]|nr:response regulator transcription factor [Sulfurospirillum sp.]